MARRFGLPFRRAHRYMHLGLERRAQSRFNPRHSHFVPLLHVKASLCYIQERALVTIEQVVSGFAGVSSRASSHASTWWRG